MSNRVRALRMPAIIGCLAILAATGCTESLAPSQAPTPTLASAAALAEQPAETAAAGTALTEQPSTRDAATATATASPVRPVSAGRTQTFVLDTQGTRLTYAIDQMWLQEEDRLETVTGQTNQVTGQLTLNYDDPAASQPGRFTANLAGLVSGDRERDQNLRSQWLQAERLPTATFVVTEMRAFPAASRPGEATPFQLVGDLTVAGATLPVTWDVTATLNRDRLTGVAITHLSLTDFNLPLPEVAGLLRATDGVTVSLDFVFKTETPLPTRGST